MNVTDRQTDGHRVTAKTALMYMHRAVKIVRKLCVMLLLKIRLQRH